MVGRVAVESKSDVGKRFEKPAVKRIDAASPIPRPSPKRIPARIIILIIILIELFLI